MFRSIFSLIFSILLVSAGFAQEAALSLEDCIQIALENNYTLRINKNLNEIADEDVTGSYSGVLPNLSLSARSGKFKAGEATDLRDVPVGIDTTTGETIIRRVEITQPGFEVKFNSINLNLNQNLFDGGEWYNAIRYAKSAKKRAELDFKAVRNDVILSVEESFFDVLKQQKLLEVYQLAVQRSEDQLNKTQKMFELGSVAKVDVFRSKVNLGNDRIQLLTQKNALLRSRNVLNVALGRSPYEPIKLKADLNLVSRFADTETLLAQAEDGNPALRRDKQQVRSDELTVSRSYGVLYPNISGFVQYGRSNERISKVYSDYNRNWTLSYGVNLSINLFNGFNDKVNIQKSKLRLRNTQNSFEQNRLQLMSNVIQLRDNYNDYLEIIKINEENLEASKEEFRLAEERYRIGSGTQLEVREAQVNLTRAEQTLVAAQYNARITQAQLQHKLGTMK